MAGRGGCGGFRGAGGCWPRAAAGDGVCAGGRQGQRSRQGVQGLVSAGVCVPSVVRGDLTARSPCTTVPTLRPRVARLPIGGIGTSGMQTRVMGVVIWDLEGVCPQTGCPAPPRPATETLGRLMGPRGHWGVSQPWPEGVRAAASRAPRVLALPFVPARPGLCTHQDGWRVPGTLSTPGDPPLSVRWDGGSDSAWERTSRGSLFWAGSAPESVGTCSRVSGRVSGCPPLLRPHVLSGRVRLPGLVGPCLTHPECL